MCHRGELKLRQQGAGAFVGGGFYRKGSAKFRLDYPPLHAAPAGQLDQVEGKSSMPERIQMCRHPWTEPYAAMDFGRGASDPRSHSRCRPQARRLNPAGFSFGFGRFGKLLLLLLRLALGRRWWSRPTKSGGPPLFEPSLKVPGYNAHNLNSGFAVPPLCDDLNAHRVRKVPRRIAPICWRR
jgi:hypothetical protein